MFKKPSSGKRSRNLSQYGLLDIPTSLDAEEPMDLSDDDMDFEAELAALSGDGGKRHRPRKPVVVPSSNLDAMIAESLKDVPSDDDMSGDEDDPELLSELRQLSVDEDTTPAAPPRAGRPAPPPPGHVSAPRDVSAESSVVSFIQDRITNYTAAEKIAKESGETSRARRFNRGLKTLNGLLKQAKAGQHISDEDIPPAVAIRRPEPEAPAVPTHAAPTLPPVPPRSTSIDPPSTTPPPTAPKVELPTSPEPKAPPQSQEEVDPAKQEGLITILNRQKEFKMAALASKQAGDKAMALEYLKVTKQFDFVVQAYKSGQEMDLSELPTPAAVAAAAKSQEKGEEVLQTSEAPPAPVEAPTIVEATSVDEALKQRLAYFQEQELKSKEAENSSKARRMGRIVKQYKDAVRLHAAGRPYDKDDLPVPPGFGPLPGDSSPSAPTPVPRSSPGAGAPPAAASPPAAAPAAAARPSRYDKQIAALLQRQKQFKEAALAAKKAGEMERAKELLRAARGFDSVLEAARGGLAVDFNSLPLPPTQKNKLEQTFDVVSAEDCAPGDEDSGSVTGTEDVMATIHHQLTVQLKLCLTNRDHCKAMGSVAEANRFENLAARVKEDLDVVAVAKRLGQDPPKCHYETREFSVVECNTDLNENDLELTIVRGIAYNVPNPQEVDTYVKFEFPYPQEAPIVDRTGCVKDTNSPEYNAVFRLTISRGSRPCLRVFKRHAIKLQVYSRGGWFRSDTVIGTVQVKLQPLETQVTLHESYPLMDGRRPAGGALEVRVRVRAPLLHQQARTHAHRWLVLDY